MAVKKMRGQVAKWVYLFVMLIDGAARAGCCIVTDEEGGDWDLTRIGGLSEGRGPGPSSCTQPDCDWLYFFDVCNAPTSIGPIPGRPNAIQCLSNYNTVAIRIEDEGAAASPVCRDLGGDGSGTEYTPIDGGLQVKFSLSVYSLTVDLLCSGQGPSTAESGLNAGPDYADDEFSAGVVKLTWNTNAVCAAAHGWLIVWSITGALCAYVAFGVAYGRHKYPPKPADSVIAHPDGLGAIAWHPHYEYVRVMLRFYHFIFGILFAHLTLLA